MLKIRHVVALLSTLTFAFPPTQNAFAKSASSHCKNLSPVKTELTISAAASLKNALAALAKNYRNVQPQTVLHFNFAASGTLQRQVEQGAPVDVFVAASARNIAELRAKKLVDAATIRVVARNTLVLIVPKSSTRSSRPRPNIRGFADLARADVRLVAIGAPQTVPAGAYAQQALEKIGVWNAVLPKAVRGKDVREVLTQVALGNVDAGIVYGSDAASSRDVRVVSVAPESSHKPIVYPAAVVSASRNAAASRAFVAYLGSASAKNVFRQFKFRAP